jgi:hypothetical protein
VVRIRVGGVRVPRAPRYFVDGAFYHVYGRIARGGMVFSERGEAARFVDVIRDVKERDGITVLAWCVMGNHYHPALRTSSVPLWRRGHGGGGRSGSSRRPADGWRRPLPRVRARPDSDHEIVIHGTYVGKGSHERC